MAFIDAQVFDCALVDKFMNLLARHTLCCPLAGDTRAQFLEHGAALLRFEAEWIELGAPFTDRRRFALQV